MSYTSKGHQVNSPRTLCLALGLITAAGGAGALVGQYYTCAVLLFLACIANLVGVRLIDAK